jgi:excisionase family DNA binding protein
MISAPEDMVALRVKSTLSALRTYASLRRKASRVDPVADAIDFCVGEVEETLAKTDEETKLLTPMQYANSIAQPVSVQTVRKWVRQGRLEAVQTAKGYLIPREAVVRLS